MIRFFYSPWPNSPSSTGEPRGNDMNCWNSRSLSRFRSSLSQSTESEEQIKSESERKFDLQLLKEHLDMLDENERWELFGNYCRHCASKEKPCHCQNDK